MDMTCLLAIIGVNVGMFAALATLIIWVVNKLDTDIRATSDRVEKIVTRIDGHANRIDQLYSMFVDLIKEVKK